MIRKDVLVRDVVKNVTTMSATSITPAYSGAGIRTKAGGFILAQSGLRIKVK